jgi:hypothetical protein
MENFPKKRGRPQKLPDWVRGTGEFADMVGDKLVGEAGEFARELLLDPLRTQRSRANQHYAERAREVVQGLSTQVDDPADPVSTARTRRGMDWILSRKTVLTELGRMMTTTDPSPKEVEKFQYVVRRVAERHEKLTAKTAVAYIRGQRMGETKSRDRVAALHHDLNAAINLHRKRYPESTREDVRRALQLTVRQVERKPV